MTPVYYYELTCLDGDGYEYVQHVVIESCGESDENIRRNLIARKVSEGNVVRKIARISEDDYRAATHAY